MSGSAIELEKRARETVDRTIRDHCRIRAWELLALNVRMNHVHVVVRCPVEMKPEDAMSQLKSWATRKLREEKLVAPDQRVWTEHGSTRWINSEEGLRGVIDYVSNQQ